MNEIAFEVQSSGNNVITADAPGYYWIENDAGYQFWGAIGAGGEYRIRDYTNNTYPFRIQSAAPTNAFFIASTGRVGVGTTIPGAPVEINAPSLDGGVLRLTDANASCDLDPDPGTLTITCPSDVRLKTNVRKASTDQILQDLASIDLFEYELISTGETAMGPVAQDLQVQHPERVTESDDGLLMVSLPNPSELLGAIQELNRLVAAQRDALQSQQQEIARLAARLAEVEAANGK